MEKIIELKPLAEIGKGYAKIKPDSVEIEISGIIGALKAWLIGGEAQSIGNIVDGKLRKNTDTTKNSGVLITQSGRQMMIGMYKESEKVLPSEDVLPPFKIDGIKWKRVTGRTYHDLSEEIRYILSNKNVYDNYRKHRHYWVGDGEECGALALCCSENENPLQFISEKILYKNGYAIVCVDKKTKKIYLPES